MLGFYVHTHWGYNNPYAARSWTLNDWDNYLSGLKGLGYDALMIWPLLDSMPLADTESDIAWLKLVGSAIDLARTKYGFYTIACINSNVIGKDEAARYKFQERPYFSMELKLNPAKRLDMEILEKHLRAKFPYLRNVDAASLIDSDPGGYVGSTNAEFVDMVAMKARVMREFNPRLELIYWMHVGWENYNRFWADSRTWTDPHSHPPLHWETRVFIETLAGLRDKVAEPWSLFAAHHAHIEATRKLGMEDKQLQLSYGVVEGEPTFPLTNCDPEWIDQWTNHYFEGEHASRFPKGKMGNAQTHCVQLPHTYLFAHNAREGRVDNADLRGFAAELLPDCADVVARSWTILEKGPVDERLELAGKVRKLAAKSHRTGPLAGLLFGSPARFLNDLASNLEVRAGITRLKDAGDDTAEIRRQLAAFLPPFKAWQQQLGFRDAFGNGGALYEAFNLQALKLKDPGLEKACLDFLNWRNPSVRDGATERLIAAAEQAVLKS
jgi:hypothetical protein